MDHKLIFSQVLIYKQNEMHSTGFVPCGVHLIFEIRLIKKLYCCLSVPRYLSACFVDY